MTSNLPNLLPEMLLKRWSVIYYVTVLTLKFASTVFTRRHVISECFSIFHQ